MFFVWKMLRTILGGLAGAVIVVGISFFGVGILWIMCLATTAIGGTPAPLPLFIPSGEHFFLAGIYIILGLIPVSIAAAYYDEC